MYTAILSRFFKGVCQLLKIAPEEGRYGLRQQDKIKGATAVGLSVAPDMMTVIFLTLITV